MLEILKTWAFRGKSKPLLDKEKEDSRITREEMRDLFADVLTEKTDSQG